MIQAAQNLLKATLAASSAFQTWVGAGNAASALARIYDDFWPEPTVAPTDVYAPSEVKSIWPCALVFTVPDRGFNIERDASGTNNWAARGELVCVLQRSFPVDGDNIPAVARKNADVDFRTTVGEIIEDMIDLSEDPSGNYLASVGFTISGPFRSEPEDRAEQDLFAMEIHVRWGNR